MMREKMKRDSKKTDINESHCKCQITFSELTDYFKIFAETV